MNCELYDEFVCFHKMKNHHIQMKSTVGSRALGKGNLYDFRLYISSS